MDLIKTKGMFFDGDTRSRLTDCCAAYSAFQEDGTLCCKRCSNPVPIGQGDGSETLASHGQFCLGRENAHNPREEYDPINNH